MTDLFNLDGKVALVTGGSRGIGLMIATGFVNAGAKVYISSRKAQVCDEVVANLNALDAPGEAVSLPADLSTEEACKQLAAQLSERESHLDILVNNAGATWGVPLEEHDDASWSRVLDINLKAVFFMTQQLVPLLQANASQDEPSRVINIGSIDGIHVPMLETYSYSASKAAVHQLTRHLASRLAPTTTVNAIAPGPFESKMMAATLDAFGDQIASGAPLKRIGRPDDMAGTATFLASRAGSYITGSVIAVDGGIATIGHPGIS